MTTSARRRPKARASAPRDTREPRDTPKALLDTALAIFEEHGFDGYTVHAVVAKSGISLGSLYHHFGSMDGLSAALYGRCMAALLDTIGAALVDVHGPRAVVTAIVRSYLGFVARERTSAAFIHAAPSSRFLAAHAASLAADTAPRLERIASALRPHIRSGALASLPEPLFEMLIIGPVAEVCRRWLVGAPGIDLEEAERLLPERIWRAVRA